MRHALAVAALLLALGGCALRGPPSCVPALFPLGDAGDIPKSPLIHLRRAPPEADALLALLEPAERQPDLNAPTRAAWFRTESGLLVYHVGTSIVGTWIGFVRSAEGWTKLPSDLMLACLD
ncbi:MAG: hypothetical protein KF823_12885 [Xanthomonadales bacterium]|nr:hypothetical protein [Xanthomonadales bacterium]